VFIYKIEQGNVVFICFHLSSFFQSVCVIGYCLFPLVVICFIAIFVETAWFRVPGSLGAFGWSTYGKK
jgi:hypothetical protein